MLVTPEEDYFGQQKYQAFIELSVPKMEWRLTLLSRRWCNDSCLAMGEGRIEKKSEVLRTNRTNNFRKAGRPL